MKKSLLAVAVAAALPALAHAQSSVTMYGILDASVEYSDDQANATLTTGATGAQTVTKGVSGLRLNSGTQSGSRFGVRGVEDLGGGMAAVFTLEHGLNIDTGDTSGGQIFLAPGATNSTTNNKFWNRQAFVGLRSGWGQVTAGRQYTPLFWALLPADFSGYTLYNNFAAFTGSNQSIASVQGPFRIDNSLAYESPAFGGLKVYAMYAFGENLQNANNASGKGTTGTQDMYGIAAGWTLGGLYLAGGYHSFDKKAWASDTVPLNDVWALTGTYRLANFGLTLGYSQLGYKQIFGNNPKLKNYMASGFANIGPGQLLLNVLSMDASDLRIAAGTGSVSARNGRGLQWGLGYTVPISRRTNWYAAYGRNDMSPLQSSAVGTQVIDSQNRFSLGIRHLF